MVSKNFLLEKVARLEAKLEELTDCLNNHGESVNDRFDEIRSITRQYPHRKTYSYTLQEEIEELLKGGYELAHQSRHKSYNIWIKRDR